MHEAKRGIGHKRWIAECGPSQSPRQNHRQRETTRDDVGTDSSCALSRCGEAKAISHLLLHVLVVAALFPLPFVTMASQLQGLVSLPLASKPQHNADEGGIVKYIGGERERRKAT
jgi:hypothetical protein